LAEAIEVIEHLLARIVELEERLRQSSQNSSRPPSSDAPAVDRPATRPPSGRRPGGQPGHEGHQRMLLPEDEVDTIVPVKPGRCRRCAAPLHAWTARWSGIK
jgi:transposase